MTDIQHLDLLFLEWRRTQKHPQELCQASPHLLKPLLERIQTWRAAHNEQFSVFQGPPLPVTPDLPFKDSPTGPGSASLEEKLPSTQVEGEGPAGSKTTWFEGRYRLIRLLGQGGFGQVWQADDTTLHRPVAIKIPRPDCLFDDNRRRLFLEEARKVAGLKHPHIVALYDAVADGATCYLACEYIDGTNLAKKIDETRLGFRESAQLIAAIAEALHFAHQHDLIHRDVKPGNILLDAAGNPYLADFGLAVSERDLLAETPMVLGTFAFMSPEQARGESNLVDARSDIYSLGVVLYRLLTGRLPFKATTSAEYREQIVKRPVRPLRSIDDQIPPALEDICLRCLRKDTQERYKCAKDVADALRAWLRSTSTKPRRAWAWGAAVLLGVATVGLGWWFLGKPTPTPPVNPVGHFDEEQAGLKPNVWYSLLRWKPKALSFPGHPSRLDWEPGGPMWIHSSDRGLVLLGHAKRPGYKIRVNMRQENWEGLFGVFFGYHHDVENGFPCCRYQLLKLHRSNPEELTWMRTAAREFDFGRLGRPLEDEMESHRLVNPPPDFCELTFVVEQKGAHSFQWRFHPLNNMGSEAENAKLLERIPSALAGGIGIQTKKCSICMNDFEIMYLDSYFNH